MRLKNKSVLVYGLGVSGIETVKFLKTKRCKIYIYDDKSYKKIDGVKWLNRDEDISFLDFVVISPGIGETKLVSLLKHLSIPIYSELKFASMFVKGKIIAVTGTNGKTTTVSLLSEIFKNAGITHKLCGNVGIPLISCVDEKSKYYICEVSSFQLENLGNFNPYISVLLNVAPDHLNRHGNMKNYTDIKFSIFDNLGKKNLAVLNENLKSIKIEKNIKAKKVYFSSNIKSDACLMDENLVYKKFSFPINNIILQGKKNMENILTCMIICDKCKIKKEILLTTINNFRGLKHRCEYVAEINGVKYINDSKATNPDSTCSALECFDNVVLLLGGHDKYLSYDDIFKYKNIKYIVTFGQARERIYESAITAGFNKIGKCITLSDAVKFSKQISEKGDVVLLSPACSSFDAFNSYEHRGDEFIRLCKSML